MSLILNNTTLSNSNSSVTFSLSRKYAAIAIVDAGVAFPVVVVVIAPDTGIKGQVSGGQSFRRLGIAADAAADQGIHMQRTQDARQRAVAVSVGIHHFRGYDLPVFHIVDLKPLCFF